MFCDWFCVIILDLFGGYVCDLLVGIVVVVVLGCLWVGGLVGACVDCVGVALLMMVVCCGLLIVRVVWFCWF